MLGGARFRTEMPAEKGRSATPKWTRLGGATSSSSSSSSSSSRGSSATGRRRKPGKPGGSLCTGRTFDPDELGAVITNEAADAGLRLGAGPRIMHGAVISSPEAIEKRRSRARREMNDHLREKEEEEEPDAGGKAVPEEPRVTFEESVLQMVQNAANAANGGSDRRSVPIAGLYPPMPPPPLSTNNMVVGEGANSSCFDAGEEENLFLFGEQCKSSSSSSSSGEESSSTSHNLNSGSKKPRLPVAQISSTRFEENRDMPVSRPWTGGPDSSSKQSRSSSSSSGSGIRPFGDFEGQRRSEGGFRKQKGPESFHALMSNRPATSGAAAARKAAPTQKQGLNKEREHPARTSSSSPAKKRLLGSGGSLKYWTSESFSSALSSSSSDNEVSRISAASPLKRASHFPEALKSGGTSDTMGGGPTQPVVKKPRSLEPLAVGDGTGQAAAAVVMGGGGDSSENTLKNHMTSSTGAAGAQKSEAGSVAQIHASKKNHNISHTRFSISIILDENETLLLRENYDFFARKR